MDEEVTCKSEKVAVQMGPLPHALCIEGGCDVERQGGTKCSWDECDLGMWVAVSVAGPTCPASISGICLQATSGSPHCDEGECNEVPASGESTP